jgi:mono/diheme cytochrome c family protein
MNLRSGILFAAAAATLGAQPAPIPQYDPAAVERGKTVFVAACGFCHGANARGGESGPDLVRAPLVLDDEGGRQLAEFLQTGRPSSGMPAFQLPKEQVADIATFLHQEITNAAFRNTYKILNILVGDPKNGEAYFAGAGGCKSCHSVTGDLKGIGAKYDAVGLQGKIVMPRNGRGIGARAQGPMVAVKVTQPSGQTLTGDLIRITDFDVTLRDSDRVVRTIPRNGDTPKVETTDPLQAHVDLLGKYTDKNIHDLTAYLVTLK